jgi:hypothetical protein
VEEGLELRPLDVLRHDPADDEPVVAELAQRARYGFLAFRFERALGALLKFSRAGAFSIVYLRILYSFL